MAARRSRIGPELMEALQLLKFSSKQGRGILSFTSGLDWADEMGELELLTTARAYVSEDISSFRAGLSGKHTV